MSATVIEGEASESDEECETVEEKTTTESQDDSSERLSQGSTSRDVRSKEIHETRLPDAFKTYTGEASTFSDTSSHVNLKNKYPGLLQRKLVDEMASFRSHVATIAKNCYKDAIRNIKLMKKSADGNIADLKASDHLLQLSSNDLWNVDDLLNKLQENDPLSNIKLKS